MTVEERVRAELLAIRKTSSGLTVATLTSSPVISGLLGNGDPRVAYNILKHAILSAEADTSLKAATSSLGLSSDKPTHLGRLDDFGTEYGYDQRQVRRYSDRGIAQLARLITSSWITEAVPCLSISGYQIDPNHFIFAVETRRQEFIEMQSVCTTLYAATNEPVVLDVPTVAERNGIWNYTRSMKPIEIEASKETSLAWVWRGELWPKFDVRWCTGLTAHGLISESLGNKLMLRLLPAYDAHLVDQGTEQL